MLCLTTCNLFLTQDIHATHQEHYIFSQGKNAKTKPSIDTHSVEVPLFTSLDTDLTQSQRQEQSNVPGDHVEPELVVQGRASGEVSQVLRDRLHEQPKQRLSSES